MAMEAVDPHADLLALLAVLRDRALHPPIGTPATQRGIARRAEISTGHLSDLLSGKVKPRPDTAHRLAEAMGADEAEALRAFRLAEGIKDSTANARIARRIRGPHMLKPSPNGFVGRTNDMAALSELTEISGRKHPGRTVTLIVGQPGVGKTWLLRHWTQHKIAKWPDGQLYADVQDLGSVGAVLHRFLLSLGATSRSIPDDPVEQEALYQEKTAGKRLLVALDNVGEADDIEPLLPGDGPSTIVLTSRKRLYGVVSAQNAGVLHLDVLTAEESRDLLIRRIGSARAARDPRGLADLVRICAGLPLALSVVSSRAALNAGWSLAEIVELYLSGSSPVNEVTVFASGYRSFEPGPQFAFRMLGLSIGVDVELDAVASLLAYTPRETRPLLDVLRDNSFLEEPSRGRFRMHEVMRSFAAERAAVELPAGEREIARRRFVEYVLAMAYRGERLLSPERPPITLASPSPGVVHRQHASADAALEWFEANDANLMAVQRFAAARGWHEIVWQLAWSLDNYQYRRGLVGRHDETWRRGLAAADLSGDADAVALARLCLGNIRARRRRHREAIRLLERAREHFATTDDLPNLAQAHRAFGFAWTGVDSVRQREHAKEALRLFRRLDDKAWTAIGLNALGEVYAEQGQYERARTCCEQALELHRQRSNRSGEAAALDSLGIVAEGAGDLDLAVQRFAEAAAVYHDLKNASSEANTLTQLGRLLLSRPGHEEAGRLRLRLALEMYAEQDRVVELESVRRLLDEGDVR
ncbi:tetratricopeptide repeat protein [Actinoplanes sp. LDG1-06]|uniref:Tetratricopeptide repeat protein n=1 Tax=Paractinoplanes ovalisporus TaxID=2810368 RepID=A0ABS2AUZ7_9ACTN|nr:helix-turn-helix domain-containing protein [Actinoplanes ovalisporus]MBM2623183.1 tetratricopeptide repeat protein [Actinoplanes ovalisporus]